MDDVEATLIELKFNVVRSIHYHDKRRAFFELFGKGLQFFSLLASSAAVVALLKSTTSERAALIFSAMAAMATLLNIVIGTTAKLETYTKLKNRFLDLQAKIEALAEPTEAEVRKLLDERFQIEKEEPPISAWLNKICYNETVDALGYAETYKRPIPWYYCLGNLRLT